MTPISARSYQEKKMTINQQLERTLTQMKTPTASQLAGGMAAGVGIARLSTTTTPTSSLGARLGQLGRLGATATPTGTGVQGMNKQL
jgi:hypothetical protein